MGASPGNPARVEDRAQASDYSGRLQAEGATHGHRAANPTSAVREAEVALSMTYKTSWHYTGVRSTSSGLIRSRCGGSTPRRCRRVDWAASGRPTHPRCTPRSHRPPGHTPSGACNCDGTRECVRKVKRGFAACHGEGFSQLAQLPSFLYSHGGTACGSAHKPRFAAP